MYKHKYILYKCIYTQFYFTDLAAWWSLHSYWIVEGDDGINRCTPVPRNHVFHRASGQCIALGYCLGWRIHESKMCLIMWVHRDVELLCSLRFRFGLVSISASWCCNECVWCGTASCGHCVYFACPSSDFAQELRAPTSDASTSVASAKQTGRNLSALPVLSKEQTHIWS